MPRKSKAKLFRLLSLAAKSWSIDERTLERLSLVHHAHSRYYRVGVILSISPWNAPVALALRAVAIPIICGNTVVLKSSELSPRSQAVVVNLLSEASNPIVGPDVS